ncbi:MAG: S-adenosylmethionine tRNA ribosyltransferase [Marinilabiliales bacterium]|nr:MAG: S-adenosylmethionine tRNA ribosyltransferase [Marinilabiliales bacterium]
MEKLRNLNIESYNYHLPEDKIPKYPLQKRDQSKLLVYRNNEISNDSFSNLYKYIEKDELLVFNNTKVVQARLNFFKETGAKIEVFCLEPFEPSDYNLSFQSKEECTWSCIVGNKRKWKDKYLTRIIQLEQKEVSLKASIFKENSNDILIKFQWDKNICSFSEILEHAGEVPLPPYLKRKAEENDKQTYQTVYSHHEGSVAAPTAGLHFTDKLLKSIQNKSIQSEFVTLHVGAGTFKPVQSERITDHEMHTEHFTFTKKSLQNFINYQGKIIATGTTTARVLESIYQIGLNIIQGKNDPFYISQWQAYENKEESNVLETLLEYMKNQNLDFIEGKTQIIIAPGYEFKLVKRLITNFHQPKSTLLLLVSALTGEDWGKIYKYALNNDFRFLSYGDGSILSPKM